MTAPRILHVEWDGLAYDATYRAAEVDDWMTRLTVRMRWGVVDPTRWPTTFWVPRDMTDPVEAVTECAKQFPWPFRGCGRDGTLGVRLGDGEEVEVPLLTVRMASRGKKS
jgi:hypothetical protein